MASSSSGGGGVETTVYEAVAAGESAERVRQVIESCAKGSAQRRVAAVNQKGSSTGWGSPKTPLKAAIRLECTDLVGLLVEAGADVTEAFHGAATPLAVCAAYGQVESVRALLRAGHDPNEKVQCIPRYNGWYKSEEEDRYCTAVHLCVSPPELRYVSYDQRKPKLPQLACLEVLVREGGAEVNARDSSGTTPLHWAVDLAEGDAAAAVDRLIQLGADVNAGCDDPEGSYTPLFSFLSENMSDSGGSVLCLRRLVVAGARTSGLFDSRGCSPLAMAAESGHADAARFLIEEARVPVDERNPETGATPLIEGCTDENYEGVSTDVIAVLLDRGADIDSADNSGRTALSQTVSLVDSAAAARLLLARGASADSIDSTDGFTPLMKACENWHRLWEGSNEEAWSVVEEVARRSSRATLRVVSSERGGRSAIDILAENSGVFIMNWDGPDEDGSILEDDQRRLIGELLACGAPVLAKNAEVVLPIAQSHGLQSAEQHIVELAARRSEARRWCAHDDVVGLALEEAELREMEERVRAAERRVEALEAEAAGQEEEESGAATTTSTEESE